MGTAQQKHGEHGENSAEHGRNPADTWRTSREHSRHMERTRQNLEDTKNLTEHRENSADTWRTWRTQQKIKGTRSNKENMAGTQQTHGGHEKEQHRVC